jgi:putative aldouronate transport system substrate-binding protein
MVLMVLVLTVGTAFATGTAETAESGSDDFTFTYFTGTYGNAGDPELSTDTAIGQILYEQTGVIVEFDRLVGDLNTRIGIDLASGDMADVIMGAGGSTPMWADGGAYIPLQEQLPEHAPVLWDMGEAIWKRATHADGNLYIVPSFIPQGDEAPRIDVAGAWRIQVDALRKTGYPELRSMPEMFDWLRDYLEEYPVNDQGEENIGFLTLIDGWRRPLAWAIDNAIAPERSLQLEPEIEYQITNTLDEWKETLRVFNEAWNDGLIDPESFIINHEQYVAKIATGRYITHWAAPWFFQDATNSLIQEGREDRTYWGMPLQIDADTPYPKGTKPMPSTEGFGISVAASDTQRIMEFFNHMSQLEQQKLVFWGVEGEDYYVDDNGRYNMTDEQAVNFRDLEYRQQRGLGLFLYGWPTGDGTYPDGNSWNPENQPEVAQRAFTPIQREFLDAYDLQVPADQWPSTVVDRKWEPLWSIPLEQGSPAQIAGSKLDAVRDKYIPTLVMCDPSEFEAYWTEFNNELESIGIEAYYEGIEDGVRHRLENW